MRHDFGNVVIEAPTGVQIVDVTTVHDGVRHLRVSVAPDAAKPEAPLSRADVQAIVRYEITRTQFMAACGQPWT